MENAKMEIVKFDNADVIATSTTPGPITSQLFKISGIGDGQGGNLKFDYYVNDTTYVDSLENITGAKELTDYVNGKLGTDFGTDDQFAFYSGFGMSLSANMLTTWDGMPLSPDQIAGLNGTYEWVKDSKMIVKQ